MHSRSVLSNQLGPHHNLLKIVSKHRDSVFAKPYAAHSQAAFRQAHQWLQERGDRALIFDSCCGVGQSSRQLARAHPECSVIGVDKSEHRIQREVGEVPDNLLLLRADLNDFYRLAAEAQWRLHKHFILYPNPWPKSAHLGRRWHGAPVFPSMVDLGGVIELRTNWSLYAQEFKLALSCYNVDAELTPLTTEEPMTPFEAKYQRSGQSLWRLIADVSATHREEPHTGYNRD